MARPAALALSLSFSSSASSLAFFSFSFSSSFPLSGLLMMLRYQNMRFEMRTCSNSGRRGLASLM